MVARHDTCSMHLLIVDFEDARQISWRCEGAPGDGGHWMLGASPVPIPFILVCWHCAWCMQTPSMIPEPLRWSGAEDVCACTCERHAYAAEGDATVEVADDDVWSTLPRLLMRRSRIAIRKLSLHLKCNSALSMD